MTLGIARLRRLEPSAEHLRLLAEQMQSDEARESLATDLGSTSGKKNAKRMDGSLGGCVFEVNLFKYVYCMCVYIDVYGICIYTYI